MSGNTVESLTPLRVILTKEIKNIDELEEVLSEQLKSLIGYACDIEKGTEDLIHPHLRIDKNPRRLCVLLSPYWEMKDLPILIDKIINIFCFAPENIDFQYENLQKRLQDLDSIRARINGK